MALFELPDAMVARMQRQRAQFPELSAGRSATIIAVDAMRQQQGRPLTSVGDAIHAVLSVPLPPSPQDAASAQDGALARTEGA